MHRTILAVSGLLFGLACTAPSDPIALGEELYEGCSACHGEAGEGSTALKVPAIAGLDKTYLGVQIENFRSNIRGKDPKDLQGQRMRPMAKQLRNAKEVEAVAAYLTKLPRANPAAESKGGDATKGKALYAPCIACHQVDGTGNPALKAPALAFTQDWYLRQQLRAFKSGRRGSNPKDIGGLLMKPMAASLTDEQAILDVVAHIMTL